MMRTKKPRLLLFVDAEFTDFKNPGLISLGIVSQDYHEFYAENTEFARDACNEFVQSVVLPKLQGGEFALPYAQLKERLQFWLSDLLEEYESALFVYDYSADWLLLGDLLADYPQLDKIEGRQDELEAGIALYFMHDSTGEHHALHDAKALFNGFKVKYAGQEPPY